MNWSLLCAYRAKLRAKGSSLSPALCACNPGRPPQVTTNHNYQEGYDFKNPFGRISLYVKINTFIET